MAVVPRRRSLIGRPASRAGATGGEGSDAGSSHGPDTGTPPPSPEGVQTALHAARPGARPREREDGAITASGLEVVERARAGRGFEGVAHQDSYAMDDPPSEEVRRDPRFARAFEGFEPATELMDRRQLSEFDAPDSLTEDELDAVLPPREPTPSPMSRGWIQNPDLVGNAVVGSGVVGSAKGPPALDGPATERLDPAILEALRTPGDPATERISRDGIPPELLAEKTVPSPFSAELLEVDDESDAVAGGRRSEHTQPVGAAASPTPDGAGLRNGLSEIERIHVTERSTDTPPPSIRSLPGRDDEPPTVSSAAAAAAVGSAQADPADEPARVGGLPPLVGLMAIVGSGGMIAGIGFAAFAFTLFFLLYYSGGTSRPESEPALPPIELGPGGPAAPGDADEPEAEEPAEQAPEEPEEAGAPVPGAPTPDVRPVQKRRSPKEEPAVVVPVPVPTPAPAPAPDLREEELPDPEPVPAPEPDRKGPFGRGKKK